MMDNLFFDTARLRHLGRNSKIGKAVRIRAPEKVSIGDNVIIDDFTYISGEVNIGDYVHIAAGCTVSASTSKITFAPFSGISSGVRVYGASSNYVRAGLDLPTIPAEYQFGAEEAEVYLQRFSLVGANTVILPGVNLPEGFACGANLLLRSKAKFEPWTVLIDGNGRTIPRRGREMVEERVRQFYHFEK